MSRLNLLSMVLFLSLPTFADDQCRSLFLHEKSKIFSTNASDDFLIQRIVKTPTSEIALAFTKERVDAKITLGPNTSRQDLSYETLALTVLKMNALDVKKVIARDIFAHVERPLTAQQAEDLSLRVEKAILEVKTLAEVSEPLSMRQSSTFDFESPLDRLHESLFPNQTPSAFYQHYRTSFAIFREKLPFALRAVMATEFYLPSMSQESKDLASLILQASYRLDSNKAQEALGRISANFLLFLETSDSRPLSSSVYQYGLIPLNDLLPNTQYLRKLAIKNRKRPREHQGPVASLPAFFDTSRPNFENLDSNYEGPTFWGPRARMIEEIPDSIVAFSKITAIREISGAHTADALAKIPAPRLMRDYGQYSLTRDELRDLFYYLRDEYDLRMNITDEYGVRLGIFRVQ